VTVWYGIIPIVGVIYSRYIQRQFRRRFIDLGLAPLLNYRQYRQLENTASGELQGGVFRFTGGIESITDGRTLWVKGEDLTIPVSLEKTNCFFLPKHEGEEFPEAPEKIRWNRISTLTEGVKVFIGGLIKMQNNRLNFISTKENPLIVIFYDCPEAELTSQIIRASSSRNEYWNAATPASLFIGAMLLVIIAASLLNRPAFRLNLISALVAVFTPVLPAIPPGFLFTLLFRRIAWSVKKYRAYWELARLPMRYLQPGQERANLSTGETYGFKKLNSLPPAAAEGEIPFLIPGVFNEEKTQEWYLFGVLGSKENEDMPARSKDPFVSFGILPANFIFPARRYAIKAGALEILASLVLLFGITVNFIFILFVLSLLTGI
jgi:hypothetical protein